MIAKAIGKTCDCIRKKIARLGLEVVDEEKKNASTTTSLVMPAELPSVEEALKDLVLRSNHSMVKKSKLNTHAALMPKHHVI